MLTGKVFRKSEENGVVYPNRECECMGIAGQRGAGGQAWSGSRAFHDPAPGLLSSLFPSVPFRGALGFWLHNVVLPVFALCFSFLCPCDRCFFPWTPFFTITSGLMHFIQGPWPCTPFSMRFFLDPLQKVIFPSCKS